VAATKYYKPFGQKIGFVLNETMEVSIDGINAENLTKSLSDNSQKNIPSIQISKLELRGGENVNVLKNGEEAYLNFELTNTGNFMANDLKVSIIAQEASNGLLFNQFSMIDKLDKSETKQIAIPIEADQNIAEQNMNLKIELSTIDKGILDADTLTFNIKKTNVEYVPDENNFTTDSNSPNAKSNDTMSDCTSTCISAGVVTIITAIISALFE
jgi:hypothetical protein